MKSNKTSILRPSRRDVFAIAAGAAAMAGSGAAQAQQWPDGPGRIVVAYAPGTSTDLFARALAAGFQNKSGQPFVVENRPGAGGWTATEALTRSKPDGQLLTVNANGIAVYGLVQKNSFDATKDLTPLAMMASAPVALLISSHLPVKTLEEFVTYLKAHPNEVLYASSGVGSAVHLYCEMFNQRAGVKMKHIPYRGLGAALPDFIAGRVHVMFSSYASGAGMVDAGQARLIAYAAEGSPPHTTKAPTVRSIGIDYEASHWWALFGPGGMAPSLQKTINEATNKALRESELAKIFETGGVSARPMSVEEFTTEVRKQYTDLKAVIDEAKLVFEAG